MSEAVANGDLRVIASATMSLDGFIADEQDGVGSLFDWYSAGDVELPSANPGIAFRVSDASADYLRSWTARLGCLVVGRRLFDITDGWGGRHPLGVPVVVVTHAAPTDWGPPGSEDFRFVSTGIADAISLARSIAGEGTVGVAAGDIAGQALDAGLLDAAAIDLAPVVLGAGKRFFGGSRRVAVLRDPVTCIAAPRVTHLLYPLQPAGDAA